jgi:hypothetical protein
MKNKPKNPEPIREYWRTTQSRYRAKLKAEKTQQSEQVKAV